METKNYDKVRAELTELVTEVCLEARMAVVYRGALELIVDYVEYYDNSVPISADTSKLLTDNLIRIANSALAGGDSAIWKND